MVDAVLFYLLSTVIVVSALSVILSHNPIHSALSLVMTMVSLALIFLLLKAAFIAGVQLIVYAGAVMVLFVMVLMLFDLKKEEEAFTHGKFLSILKVCAIGWFLGLVAGVIYMSMGMVLQTPEELSDKSQTSIKALSQILFTEYVFAFEALGLLLLLIAIGVVAISRIKGGTHAKS